MTGSRILSENPGKFGCERLPAPFSSGHLERPFVSWLLLVAGTLIAGCSPAVPDASSPRQVVPPAAQQKDRYRADDLDVAIGQYMPPLEGGELQIAAPENWDWARPGSDYLVGFVPQGAELNNLPRILVSSEPNPYADISRVTEESREQIEQQVGETVADLELVEPVRSLVLGENVFACYETFAKRKNAVVSRQFLETVALGRRYVVRLEAYELQADRYRDAAYAVAMSMKFGLANGSSSGAEASGEAGGAPAAATAVD